MILVHGYDGYLKNQFGTMADPASIISRVSLLPGYRLVQQFQYEQGLNSFGGNSERLAQTIDCAARLSAQSGGPGKVVVIGYSEGAAMAHTASRKPSWDRTTLVANELAFVITVGDAFRLRWLAAAEGMPMNVPFAAGFPVHAIAGDVTKVYLRKGVVLKSEDTNGDNLIPADDALVSGTTQFRAECRAEYSDSKFKKMTKDAPCRHGELLNYAPIRQDVENALRAFFVPAPPDTTSDTLTVGSLQITYPPTQWPGASYGAMGPGGDSFAIDASNGVPCTNCTDSPPPIAYAFLQVTNLDGWCMTTAEECMTMSSPALGPAPALTVGGRAPSWAARLEEVGYQGTMLVWCFDVEMVCLSYRRGTSTPQLEPSQALYDLAASAKWIS